MQNKSKLNRQKIIATILNIVIIVLCLVLVIMLALAIESVHSTFMWRADGDSFYYAIKDGNYDTVVEYYHRNIQAGHEDDADMKEYYGVAKYYEAASLYKAYSDAGNAEQAKRYRERMNSAQNEMGEWVIAREAIHEQLGIE